MATHLRCRLKHTWAQALTGHFHQTKARDTTDLNTGAVCFQLVFHPLFNGDVVAAFVHVDKIDHDQTSQVTQAQLASHLIGGLKVGFSRGLLDRAFFGRAARVHVDRNKRLCDPDHDVTTRWQLNRWVKHTCEVALDLIPRIKRQLLGVELNVLCV